MSLWDNKVSHIDRISTSIYQSFINSSGCLIAYRRIADIGYSITAPRIGC